MSRRPMRTCRCGRAGLRLIWRRRRPGRDMDTKRDESPVRMRLSTGVWIGTRRFRGNNVNDDDDDDARREFAGGVLKLH